MCNCALRIVVNNELILAKPDLYFMVVIGAGGLQFESRVCKIRYSVADGLPPLRCFSGAVLLGAGQRK